MTGNDSEIQREVKRVAADASARQARKIYGSRLS